MPPSLGGRILDHVGLDCLMGANEAAGTSEHHTLYVRGASAAMLLSQHWGKHRPLRASYKSRIPHAFQFGPQVISNTITVPQAVSMICAIGYAPE